MEMLEPWRGLWQRNDIKVGWPEVISVFWGLREPQNEVGKEGKERIRREPMKTESGLLV